MNPSTPVKTLPLKIRSVTEEDVPFIFNSWLKSYRDMGPIARGVTNLIYYENHHKILQKIMQRSETWVASAENNPNDIFGYIVGEYISGVFVMHYIYVKHMYRKLGIGKLLFSKFSISEGAAKCYTHQTETGQKLSPRYGFIYHPYVMLVDYELPEGSPKIKYDTKKQR